VPRRSAFLISTGTAICGGSAIAAVGPITGATADEMSVSLGTIFVLNSVALLTFPAIGLWLKLSQSQFGLWAALAIHDTSSVVGASAKYGAIGPGRRNYSEAGARALDCSSVDRNRRLQGQQDANPVAVVHLVLLSGGRGQHLLFSRSDCVSHLSSFGKLMLVVTLFLIGASLSPAALRKVGPRPLLQGVLSCGLSSLFAACWQFARAGYESRGKKFANDVG
jgi:uncharacterized membrane protein YadS